MAEIAEGIMSCEMRVLFLVVIPAFAGFYLSEIFMIIYGERIKKKITNVYERIKTWPRKDFTI